LHSNGDCWLTPTHLCTLMLLVSAAFIPSNQKCGGHKERSTHQPAWGALIALCSPVREHLTVRRKALSSWSYAFADSNWKVTTFTTVFLSSFSVFAVRLWCSVICRESPWWWKTTGSGRSWRANSQRCVKDKGQQWDEDAGEWTHCCSLAFVIIFFVYPNHTECSTLRCWIWVYLPRFWDDLFKFHESQYVGQTSAVSQLNTLINLDKLDTKIDANLMSVH